MTSTYLRASLAAVVVTAIAGSAAAPALGENDGAPTWTIPVRSQDSARAALREAAGAMRTFRGLRLRSAIADRSDRFVEASFTATYRNTPVAGILLASREGAVATYDTLERAPHTVPATLSRIALRGRGGGPTARPLHRISFGSGSVALPDSWNVINSYQGCVEAASQQDHAYLAFGCSQAALAPPLLPGTDPRTVLVVNAFDPVAALQRLILSPAPAGLGASAVHVREVEPVQATANGRAAYVLFDYTLGGASFTGLALVNLAAVDTRQFILYKSLFMTPAPTFPQLAPALWKSWRSWAVNGDVLTSRLFAAAQSMRETGDVITGAYWDRQHVQDRAALGFDQYIRDAAQGEDLWTGARANGDWGTLDALAKMHPDRYRIVPLSELQI